jgi:hypothetical protein
MADAGGDDASEVVASHQALSVVSCKEYGTNIALGWRRSALNAFRVM